MVKAILFDLDGVLVDSYEVWFYLLNAVAAKHRYAPITREQYKTSWGQGLEVDVKLYYTRHTVEQLRAEYDVLYPDFLHHMKVIGVHRKRHDTRLRRHPPHPPNHFNAIEIGQQQIHNRQIWAQTPHRL